MDANFAFTSKRASIVISTEQATSNGSSRCVVLIPVPRYIEPECEQSLRELEVRGYEVRRIRGYSQVDVARCQIATDALADGFDELLWIDSDVGFSPDSVERLRSHGLPFVCGIYPKKARREFACSYAAGTQNLVFGQKGGLTPLEHVGFGFTLTHRCVYDAMIQRLQLPRCNERFGKPLYPFFMPLVRNEGAGHWYLGEDYAFCERARQCGYSVVADTTIRLWHVGHYSYGWEDAGSDKDRYASYSFKI
jgi:hypothetical protein